MSPHRKEVRPCPAPAGVEIRIVRRDGLFEGPWVIGSKPAAAWKAYKKARREAAKGMS